MKVRSFVALATLVLTILTLDAAAQLPLPSWGSQTGLYYAYPADLNHDGSQDLVGVASTSTGYNITALLNDGTGRFPTVQTSSIAGILYSGEGNIAVGDFNNDGFPDLMIPGEDSITGVAAVGVMLGNGDGTFGKLKVIDEPGTGTEMISGNFTGHGNVDVAILNCSNCGEQFSTIVLPGNGDGTFGQPIVTATQMFSSCIVTADFNHDGFLDVVAGGPTVYFGDGSGHFGNGQLYPVTDAKPYLPLAVGDFSGVGLPDIAVVTNVQDVTVLLNKGEGTFKLSHTFNGGLNQLLAGDFNGDGKQDLIISGGTTTGSSGFSFLQGRGDGTFVDAVAQSGERDHNRTVMSVDLNNDGKIDLLSYNGTPDVQLGNGDGSFQTPIKLPSTCDPVSGGIVIGDFNDDHKMDITMITSTTGGVSVCLGNGDGTFKSAQVYDQGIPHQSVVVGDFNNDGKLDLAVSDLGGVSILLGNGDGTFQNGIPNAVNARYPVFFAGDFNGDGKLDIVTTTSQGISVLFGNGDGTLQTAVNSTGTGSILAVGDLNNDGKLDLVLSGISVQLGNGDGTFQPPVFSYPDGIGPVFLTDFDKRGKLDLAVISAFYVQVFPGKGDGTFLTPPISFPGNDDYIGATSADINGDGFADLLILAQGSPQDGKIVVYYNPR